MEKVKQIEYVLTAFQKEAIDQAQVCVIDQLASLSKHIAILPAPVPIDHMLLLNLFGYTSVEKNSDLFLFLALSLLMIIVGLQEYCQSTTLWLWTMQKW